MMPFFRRFFISFHRPGASPCQATTQGQPVAKITGDSKVDDMNYAMITIVCIMCIIANIMIIFAKIMTIISI